jgi:hypothetical protein
MGGTEEMVAALERPHPRPGPKTSTHHAKKFQLETLIEIAPPVKEEQAKVTLKTMPWLITLDGSKSGGSA